jgi:hypothetical protein
MLSRRGFVPDPTEQIPHKIFPALAAKAIPQGLRMPSRVSMQPRIPIGVVEVVAVHSDWVGASNYVLCPKHMEGEAKSTQCSGHGLGNWCGR